MPRVSAQKLANRLNAAAAKRDHNGVYVGRDKLEELTDNENEDDDEWRELTDDEEEFEEVNFEENIDNILLEEVQSVEKKWREVGSNTNVRNCGTSKSTINRNIASALALKAAAVGTPKISSYFSNSADHSSEVSSSISSSSIDLLISTFESEFPELQNFKRLCWIFTYVIIG